MALIKNNQLLDDPWVALADGDEIPDGADCVIVSYDRWAAANPDLAAYNGRLGIRLTSAQSPSLIRDHLDRFDLIVFDFDKFKDGRAFSHARLLRERYGYTGEVRAAGDFIVDQIGFLHRGGFDAFEVDEALSESTFNTYLHELSYAYQPAGDVCQPIWALRNRHKAAAE